MEVLQIAVYIVLLISLLSTIAMAIMNMISTKKRDKAYYKILDDIKQEASNVFNEDKE